MKKLLLISHNQFGYQINIYKYAQYLKEEFDITYFCFDYGRLKIYEDNVNVIYVEKYGAKVKQLIYLLSELHKLLKKNDFNLIILKHFPFSSLIRLFTTSKIILSIQTGSVSNNSMSRFFFNMLLHFESMVFNHNLILSDSLKKLLRISNKKTTVIPLGSEVFCTNNHKYNKLNLIYIGNLNNRDIEKTIYGTKEYLSNSKNKIELTYLIVGFGNQDVERKIINLISELDLNEIVKFAGLVPYNHLSEYVTKSNIGVSFVPITKYFDVQPPSKTIEYLLSGLPVIATATKENKKIINSNNGILIDDTISDFAEALCIMEKSEFDNQQIRESMLDHKWRNIVNTKLIPLINKILSK